MGVRNRYLVFVSLFIVVVGCSLAWSDNETSLPVPKFPYDTILFDGKVDLSFDYLKTDGVEFRFDIDGRGLGKQSPVCDGTVHIASSVNLEVACFDREMHKGEATAVHCIQFPVCQEVDGLFKGHEDESGVMVGVLFASSYKDDKGDDENELALMFDGRIKTGYLAEACKVGERFSMHFSEPVSISGLNVITGDVNGKYSVKAGQIQISTDGVDYLTMGEIKNGIARIDLPVDDVKVRSILILVERFQGKSVMIREVVLKTSQSLSQVHRGAVNIDYSETPDVADWARKAQAIAESYYPVIAKKLRTDGFIPPQQVQLRFRKEMKGIAGTGGSRINISSDWIRNNPDDIGMVIHELTHVIQNYPYYEPKWLVEGIADYVRYVMYEPQSNQLRFLQPDLVDYKRGYWDAAAFLDWIEKSYPDKEVVMTLNASIRKRQYNEQIFKEITGKSLADLWVEFMGQLQIDR